MGPEMTNERDEIILTTEEEERIVDAVYNRFYLQVGKSFLRAIMYILGAAALYLVFFLTQKGWLTPEIVKEVVK